MSTPGGRHVLPVTDLSLVLLVGATGSGKSTFARRHFRPTEVLSFDRCRGLVADDENDRSADGDAMDVLHHIAGKRLAAGRLTVVDGGGARQEDRRRLAALARAHDVLPVAVVLDLPERVCVERNAGRPDRAGLSRSAIRRHRRDLRRSLRGLEHEGFRTVHVLRTVEEVEAAEVIRAKRFKDLNHLTGPFDIIGDVHGCSSELEALLAELGYEDGLHPGGRTAVFLGGLVDRGPDSAGVLHRVMGMVRSGNALWVSGNHRDRPGRHPEGSAVRQTRGPAAAIEQLRREPPRFTAEVGEFLAGLVSHRVLDGGRPTALRWPERELVDVPAGEAGDRGGRPLDPAPPAPRARPLDLADADGCRIVATRHLGSVTVREESAAAALEAVSRWAADPRLVPYLPPATASADASAQDGRLEHPAEAFARYRADGIAQVVCEEMHRGSRATVLLCKDRAAARARFGVEGPTGSVYHRTGRPFFAAPEVTEGFLARLRSAVTDTGLWAELDTDWLLLDGALLPWPPKPAGPLRNRYATAGTLLPRQRARTAEAAPSTDAIPFSEAARFAPLQLLAAAGRSLAAVPRDEQLFWLDRLVAADGEAGTGLLRHTRRILVDTADEASLRTGTDWWRELMAAGGEGMVVKPLQACARDGRGRLVQPGLTVRGPEYQRSVHGPQYPRPEQPEQLRRRRGPERSPALRGYALALEALDRLAAGEPLWRVHEAAFAVPALESEPVDPLLGRPGHGPA